MAEVSQRRKKRSMQQQEETDATILFDCSSDESSIDTDDTISESKVADELSYQSPVKSQGKKTSTAGFFQSDILQSQKLISGAASIKITPEQQRIYSKSLIKETGGDQPKLKLS